MSTALYGNIVNERQAQTPAAAGAEAVTGTPGRSHYVEVVAALVPAEVLSLHAVIMSYVLNARPGVGNVSPQSGANEGGHTAMNWISALPKADVDVLKWSFFGLILLSLALYAFPRFIARHWDKFDWIRMSIAPIAFCAWTMLQPVTAFDALGMSITPLGRTVAALFLAVILAGVANALSKKI